MKNPALPPAPVNGSCPLWLLVEWAEVFRNGLVSTSAVALEVNASELPPGCDERWLALVTWAPKRRDLRSCLKSALRKICIVPSGRTALQRGSVLAVFHRMTATDQSVWFFPLPRWDGAALFVRRPACDPGIRTLVDFNRRSERLRPWKLPRPRVYPAEWRRVYAEECARRSTR